MRLALISDIHGNEIALKAVLDDIADEGVGDLVFLGDVATLGPNPRAAIELLQSQNCPCIMGNHDEFLLTPQLVHKYTQAPEVISAIDWCRDQLSSVDLEFIRTFRPKIELTIDGIKLLLFHGSPRSHMENLLATTSSETIDEIFEGEDAEVMVGGHTHIQMLRQHQGRLIINAGSVGQPFKEFVAGNPPQLLSHAEYALIEIVRGNVAVLLKRIRLDQEKLLHSARASGSPLRSWLIQQYHKIKR